MEKIKEKLEKTEFYKKPAFWIFTFITILFLGNLYRMEYATDTYCVFTNESNESIGTFIRAGRFLTALMLKIFFSLKLSENTMYLISFSIAIVSIVTSMYRLYKIIYKDIENNKISIIVSILIILNIFIIELMLFIEKGIMVLSILFNVLAFEQLLKVFEGNRKNIIGVFIFMLLANCSYQGTVALFVVLSMIYILKKSRNVKDFILKNILTAFLYGIPAGINYIGTRFIYGSERVTGNVNLKSSILKIVQNILSIFKNTCQIMPKWFFFSFLVMIIITIIYKAFKSETKLSERMRKIGGIIYIIAGTIISCVMPQLLQNTESIWMVPRTVYALASLIGVMILFLYSNFKVEKRLENLIIIISVLYIATQYFSFQQIIVDRYIINNEDKTIATSIENEIQEYEANTGSKVNKIVVCHDKEVMYTYQGMFVTGDMNVKAFLSDWATVAIMKYYSGRNFEVGETNLEIQEYFEQKNWNTYNRDQIIIQENTVYICNF